MVDPDPLAITNGYLVLRAHIDRDPRWTAMLADTGLHTGVSDESIVPMPTGGIFAEAMLGRLNSAEKLDLTRFWNWADSPLPVTASEIEALSAASRNEAGISTPVPAPAGSPALTVINPPALPDFTGTAAVLAALQNGSTFRDMSGLGATIAAAQAGLEQAAQSARDFSGQAGENVRAAINQAGKNMTTAADLYASAFGSRPGTGGNASNAGGSTVSERGALLNKAAELDRVDSGGSSRGAVGSGPADNVETTRRQDQVLGIIPVSALATTTDAGSADTARHLLVGDPDGPLDLAGSLVAHLGTRSVPATGGCIAATLRYLVDTCRSLGVDTGLSRTADGTFELPLIGTTSGATLSVDSLRALLWFSFAPPERWSRLPQRCRGAGAPGALLYADLAEGRTYLSAHDDWPQGLLPGALLQLWPDEETYLAVREGPVVHLGHSCIFLGYTRDGIRVADQISTGHELRYGWLALRYVIGANPSRARIVEQSSV